MKYRTPLITSVTSSIEGNTIPVTMSSAIFPYAVTFGGTCGNEKDGTLHLLIQKEKDRNAWKCFSCKQIFLEITSCNRICHLHLVQSEQRCFLKLVVKTLEHLKHRRFLAHQATLLAIPLPQPFRFLCIFVSYCVTKWSRFDCDKQSTSLQQTPALEHLSSSVIKKCRCHLRLEDSLNSFYLCTQNSSNV